MDLLSRDQLTTLAQQQADPCVSLYMPTMRVEADVSQNPIRFKNLLRQTRSHLKDAGHREAEIDNLLAEAKRRIDDSKFWMHQSDGLAVFISPGETSFFRLPLNFEELCFVGRRLHLKPLFPLIATNNRFFLLALDQKDVRLYLGTHYGLEEINSDDIPRSIDEVIDVEDRQKNLQHRTANRVGNRVDAAFHGHGGMNDDNRSRPQDKLGRFFREVASGVKAVLRDENAPLLLSGVESHLPIYRELNSYPDLIEDEIVSGNTEHINLTSLHSAAWPILDRHFKREQDKAIQKFKNVSGQDGNMSSSDVEDIIAASAYRRVDTLFATIGEHRWGTFDPSSGEVTIRDQYQYGDEDLLNLAAINTYLNGGVVHALRRENMPTDSPLAAMYRFPVEVEA